MSTCPSPSNDLLTPLNANNFTFGLQKVPEVSWNVTKCQLPSITASPSVMDTPLIDVNFRGGKLEYGELVVTFLIDSGFQNYLKLYNWMVRTCEHSTCFYNTDNLYDNEMGGELWTLSDGFINVMAPNKKDVLYTIKFIDMLIYSISEISFDTQAADATPITCDATFKFSYFVFAKNSVPQSPPL